MSTAGTLGVMDWTVSTQVLIASMTLSWLLRIVFRTSFCRSWVGVLAMALPPSSCRPCSVLLAVAVAGQQRSGGLDHLVGDLLALADDRQELVLQFLLGAAGAGHCLCLPVGFFC